MVQNWAPFVGGTPRSPPNPPRDPKVLGIRSLNNSEVLPIIEEHKIRVIYARESMSRRQLMYLRDEDGVNIWLEMKRRSSQAQVQCTQPMPRTGPSHRSYSS